MTCSLKLGHKSYRSPLLRHYSTLLLLWADQAELQPHCWPQYEKLMHICHLDPSLYSVNVLEDLRLDILHIAHTLHVLLNSHFCHRREVLKQRSSNFSLSLCATFAFAKQNPLRLAADFKLYSSGKCECRVYFTYFTYFTYLTYFTYSFHSFCDKSAISGICCRWWYVNSWALSWRPSNSGNKQWKP